MSQGRPRRPSWLVPEVVQTSAMDCGPASLKCLLEGHGIPVSYGRLREACQTDVDGTSIDSLEDVANQLGLYATQLVVPPDHLLLKEADLLPALVVIRLPSGLTHFIVVWRRFGPFVQVMDPGTGRSWPTQAALLRDLYIHELAVSAEDWRDYALKSEALAALHRRLLDLGADAEVVNRWLATATADPGWQTVAALDASARLVNSLAEGSSVPRGRPATQLVTQLFERCRSMPEQMTEFIPREFWTAYPTAPAEDGTEQILLRGAVLVRISGEPFEEEPGEAPATPSASTTEESSSPAAAPPPSPPPPPRPLAPDLVAALTEAPLKPSRTLFRLLREDGLLAPAVLLLAILLSGTGLMVEALLLRGLLDLSTLLKVGEQRLAALVAFFLFMILLYLLELPLTTGIQRLGRHLELRLRREFQMKIPRLGDRFFRSRLVSDLAERSHNLPMLRAVPQVGSGFIGAVFSLLLTTLGIILLEPRAAPIALTVAALSVILPLVTQPLLTERDLRQRTIEGALTRFYLDALLGLVPIRCHSAQQALRSEHEKLLLEWIHSGLNVIRASLWVDGLLNLAGIGSAVWLLSSYLSSNSGATGGILLLVFWSVALPDRGQQVARFARLYPGLRNVTLRLLEPLHAPQEDDPFTTPITTGLHPLAGPPSTATAAPVVEQIRNPDPPENTEQSGSSGSPQPPGVAIRLERVHVSAAGQNILTDIDLAIPAGAQVAVVGASGSGKSSLVGLLLGWHRPAAGQVLIDGLPLDAPGLRRLRRETAWVDPGVQLWNRSLLYNLRYGAEEQEATPFGALLEAAELSDLLESLPDGLQTVLGEGGALVSGGQGQRVRLGRGLLRADARLVILDEPFRGLDRARRARLLKQARRWWNRATLIIITHDLEQTTELDRIFVLDQGRLVEQGPASDLLRQDSRYRQLMEAEAVIREELQRGTRWRRLWIDHGVLRERDTARPETSP